MFDDGCRGIRELVHETGGGLEIHQVIKGKLFALELLGRGQTAPASRRIKIERCALMGVFPVAQIHGFVEIQAQVVRQRGSGKRRHGGRDQVQSRRWGRFTASGCSRLVGRPLLQSH